MINLQNKKFSIFGIQGSGKTYLAKKLLSYFHKPLVYEIHPDYRDTKAMIYKPKDLTIQTLNDFCGTVKQLALKRKVDLFVIDEADMFFRSNFDLMTNLNDLIINHRHYNLAICFISRRPQDIPTKIVESSHVIFTFALEGANVKQKFQNIHPNFPELIGKLDYKAHNFVVKELGIAPYIANPIK